MTPIEILSQARDLLATRGWTQDTLEDAQGRLCIVGAIHVSVEPTMLGTRTLNAVFAHLGQAIHRKKCPHLHYHCIAAWNDTPGRTRRQVLNAFDGAIALAEAQAAIGRAAAQRKSERETEMA